MIKLAVALALFDPARPGQVLLVQRPADDQELPAAWGLPAASLTADESWQDTARRAARDKLGIDIVLGPILEHGRLHRATYQLDMRLVQAAIRHGQPTVPQPHPDVTQYQACRWGDVAELTPAAIAGSLCARLCLDWAARSLR